MPKIILSEHGAQYAGGINTDVAWLLNAAKKPEEAQATREVLINALISKLKNIKQQQTQVRQAIESYLKGGDISSLIKERRQGKGQFLKPLGSNDDKPSPAQIISDRLQTVSKEILSTKPKVQEFRKTMGQQRSEEIRFTHRLREEVIEHGTGNLTEFIQHDSFFQDAVKKSNDMEQLLQGTQNTFNNLAQTLNTGKFRLPLSFKTDKNGAISLTKFTEKAYFEYLGIEPTKKTNAQAAELKRINELITTLNKISKQMAKGRVLFNHGNEDNPDIRFIGYSGVNSKSPARYLSAKLQVALDNYIEAEEARRKPKGKDLKISKRQRRDAFDSAKQWLWIMQQIQDNPEKGLELLPKEQKYTIRLEGKEVSSHQIGTTHELYALLNEQFMVNNNGLQDLLVENLPIQEMIMGHTGNITSRHLFNLELQFYDQDILDAFGGTNNDPAASETLRNYKAQDKDSQEKRDKTIKQIAKRIGDVRGQFGENYKDYYANQEELYATVEHALVTASDDRTLFKEQDTQNKIDDFLELDFGENQRYFIAFNDKSKSLNPNSKGGNIDALQFVTDGASLFSSWDLLVPSSASLENSINSLTQAKLQVGFSPEVLISSLINATSASIYHNETVFEEVQEFFQSMLNGYFMETTFNAHDLENQISNITTASGVSHSADMTNTYFIVEVNNVSIPAESCIDALIAQLEALRKANKGANEVFSVNLVNNERRQPFQLYLQSLAAVPPKGNTDPGKGKRWDYAAFSVMNNIKITTAIDTSMMFYATM